MSSTNFYLKKANRVNGRSLIVLYKRYNGISLAISTGQTIDLKNWNKKKQRVKSNTATIEDGTDFLNAFLDKLETLCDSTYRESLKNGIPPAEKIKSVLKNFIQNPQGESTKMNNFFSLVDRFVAGEIKTKGKDKSRNTLLNYMTVRGHLKEYQARYKSQITFEKIDLDFFYSYVSFLRDIKRLAQNSIAKDITVIKVFMNEAVDLGLTDNMQFKHKKFSIREEETDSVYLTEQEINKVYKLNLSQNNRLEKVRDLFVFGCCVGLRFSDYSYIKSKNIVEIDGERFIKLITTKTRELVIIPCSPIVLQILDKYKDNPNSLPPACSNQKFNNYIKEVCKLAGLDEPSRLSTNPEKKLYECISSHTARRSFCTNLYLEGFPTIELMKVSGHKTETAFLKYIKVSKLDAAKRLSRFMKKRWDDKMLRVA